MSEDKGKKVDIASQNLHHKPFVFQEFSDSASARGGSAAAKSADSAAPQTPPGPVAPSFSEEELMAAQKEAQDMGRRKGYEDAKREWDEATLARDTQLVALLEGLTARMDGEVAAQEKLRSSQRGDMANIVLMIARKLVGNALDTQPIGSIEPMVNECLTMLAGEGKLTIVVSESLSEPLAAHLAKLPREGQIIEVQADAHLRPGDCRVQWPGGKAERDQDGLWKEMEKIVKRALSSPKKDEQPDG